MSPQEHERRFHGEACRVAAARVVVLEWPYVQEEQGPPLEHSLTQEAILEIAGRPGLGAVEALRLSHMDLYRIAWQTQSHMMSGTGCDSVPNRDPAGCHEAPNHR